MYLGTGRASSKFGAELIKAKEGAMGAGRIKGLWDVECYDSEGKLRWVEKIENLITNEGLDHLLDITLSGGTQITTWYVGLTDDSPTIAAADTMASHAGWAEATGYSESVRQTWSDGGVSSQSVDNSASKATFSINATDSIGGAFLVSNSTKSGTTGILYAVGAFSGGNRSVESGDSLLITATFTMADDGA